MLHISSSGVPAKICMVLYINIATAPEMLALPVQRLPVKV